MARIAQSVAELIGETPLVRLARLEPSGGAEVLAKLEFCNPSGSDKDRVVQTLLAAAEASGALQPGSVIVEPTSGNIAFSLAMLAVPRGYRVMLVMPEGLPAWRTRLLQAMGAEVITTPAADGMRGAIRRAEALTHEYPHTFRPNQFANPLNPAAHEQCADEIWQGCNGEVAAVVVPVSTGGAVTGIGRRLKALSGGAVRVVAVEPAASPVLTGGAVGTHRLLGMGPPFIPDNYDATVVDEVLSVSDTECHDTLLRLYRNEGVLSGPAGGAALAAALRLAARPTLAGQRLVALLPDRMERYADLPFWETFPALVMPLMTEE